MTVLCCNIGSSLLLPPPARVRQGARVGRQHDLTSGGTVAYYMTSPEGEKSLEELLAMGLEEGLKGAMGQIDAILAE